MSLEFDPNKTASPEDLFGNRGAFLRDAIKVDTYVRVSTSLEEVRQEANVRGFQLSQIREDHILHTGDQTLSEAPLSFIQDPIDAHVWVAQKEFEKYEEIFRNEDPS
jgi:hypothetical protein